MSDLVTNEQASVYKEDELIIRLSSVVKEARAVVDELDPVVKRFELQNTEILFGMSGGLIFGLITYLVMLIYTSASTPNILIASVVSIPIGLILPMIFFRGLTQWRLEKNIRLMKIKLDAIRTEIYELNQLQRVPAQIKEDIWEAYQDALKAFNKTMKEMK